jgi:hypothetical protein
MILYSTTPSEELPLPQFHVAPAEWFVAAVKAAGGASGTQGGSVRLGNGKVGFVRDPSGILVELAQP